MEPNLTQDNQQKRFCPYCGQAVLLHAPFCHNCGSNLSAPAGNAGTNPDMSRNSVLAATATISSIPEKKNSRGLSILGGVCALLSILAFGIVLLQQFQVDLDKPRTFKMSYITHDISSSYIWLVGLIVGCALLLIAIFICVLSIFKEKTNVINAPTLVLCIIAVVMMIFLLPKVENRIDHYKIVRDSQEYESKTDKRIKDHNDAIRDVTAAIDRDLGGR